MGSKKIGYQDNESSLNNIASFLSKHKEESPSNTILRWVDQKDLASWSFDLKDPLKHSEVSVAELDALVGKIGAGLKDLGIKKGDCVIVFIPMSLYLYASMFAVQKIGAVAVFLDSWARRDQMGAAAKTVNAKAMISVEQAFEYLGEIEEIKSIPLKISAGPTKKEYSSSVEKLMAFDGYIDSTPVEKEHTALVTFTTGSSGTPKGANRTHRFLAAQHYALNRHLPYEKSDVDLPVFPIFSLNNLAAGVTTIIPAIDVGAAPDDKTAMILIAQLKSTNTTCTTLSPSILRAVYAFCLKQNMDLKFLKRIITGGAPVSKDDLVATKKIASNAEILVLYGSTEVEPMAHIEAKEMIGEKENEDFEIVAEGVNVGHFDEGLQVRFLKIDENPIYIKTKDQWADLLVSEGSVGEIIVSGEHVCESYYNNEEAFSRAKIRDENGVVWHRTGDLGKLDDKRNLWLVGRVHNAINRDGIYQFPVRAEIVLKKLDFIDKSAFLGMPDAKLGEMTCAVFSVKGYQADKKDFYIQEVKRIMKKNNIVVDRVVYTDDIPMDPRHHSKVEYGKLREIIKDKK